MPEYFITAAKIYRLKNDEGTSDIIDKGINLFPQDQQLYFYKSAYLRDQKKWNKPHNIWQNLLA